VQERAPPQPSRNIQSFWGGHPKDVPIFINTKTFKNKISMKKITLLILVFGCLQLSGQSSFFEIFTGTNSCNYPYDMMIMPNENIVFINNSIDVDSEIYTNEIYEYSPQGELLKLLTFKDTTCRYETFTHLFYIEDTLFVLGWGENIWRQPYPYLLLKTFDENLIEANTYRMKLENPYYVNGLSTGQVKYINDRFIYFTTCGSTTLFPFYAEITRTGQIKRIEFDNQPNGYRIPYDFLALKDQSGYQAYSFWYPFSGLEVGGYLFNYDKEMNVKSYLKLPESFFSYFTHVPITDTTFYLSGLWHDYAADIGKKAGVLKMNTEGEVTDRFLFRTPGDSSSGPAYRHSLEVLSDGNLMFCCTDNITIEIIPQLRPTRIMLFKLTPDLEVIWHRFIGTDDAKYDAYLMHTTPSEEIVILGAYSGAPPPNNWVDQDILFIKTDKDGLITGTNDLEHKISSTEAIVFPNPASEVVYVEYSMAYASATFSLTDISGKTVLEKTLTDNKSNVNISGIPTGTYIYRITHPAGLNETGKMVVR
jgi:hypothetical protein